MVDKLLGLLKIWDTENGLLLFLFSWIFLSLSALPKFLKEIFLIDPYQHINLFLILCVSGLIIYYLPWRYRRSFSFLRGHVNVILAIYNTDNSSETESIIINLKHRLSERIKDFNLTKKVFIDFKPTDFLIESVEKAKDLVQEGYVGSTLIVWGKAYRFGNEIRLSKLHFTYEFAYKKYYSKLPNDFYKELFTEPIQKAIDVLKWKFPLNFYYTFEKYALNISEITMFILGKTLASVGQYVEALDVLTKLYHSFWKLSVLEQKERGSFIVSVKETLISLYEYLLNGAYFKNDLPNMEKYSSKLLSLNPYHYNANLSAAICAEKMGDRKKAKEFTKTAKENAPKNANTHIINLAYFAIDEGHFSEAIKYYRFLIKYNVDFSPVLATDFLQEKYIQTKKIEFLFGEGLIKINWLDKEDGKKVMKQFLKKALRSSELKSKYKLLIEEGEKLLKN